MREALPDYKGGSITADELLERMRRAEKQDCLDEKGKPILTILDYRTENFLQRDKPIPSIKTSCRTIRSLLDDLEKSDVRGRIPGEGLVVLISETGNRDSIAMKYLYKFGFTNAVGLRFGMRAWIKSDYPVEIIQSSNTNKR